jgi:hypothetical protein
MRTFIQTHQANESITRSIAGCLRFLTLIQSGERYFFKPIWAVAARVTSTNSSRCRAMIKSVFHRTILYFFAAFLRGAVGGAGLP